MTRLKICGLRDIEHALAAAAAGADFLGFVFVPGVRRRISNDQGRAIISQLRHLRRGSGPRIVGLFADQPLDDVNHTIDYCGLDLAQLCGDEPPDYWRRVSAPVIKQVRVRDRPSREDAVAETLGRVEEVIDGGQTAMLDRYEAGAKGGTGRTFDWSIAARVARVHDILLAGGLTPDNVARAIDAVRPWGVDVSSGVETDGVKDSTKIAAFAREAQRASRRIRG